MEFLSINDWYSCRQKGIYKQSYLVEEAKGYLNLFGIFFIDILLILIREIKGICPRKSSMKSLFLKTLYIINAVVAPYSGEKKKEKKMHVLTMDSCSLWIHDANSFWEKKCVLSKMSKWMHGRISGELVLG